MAVDPIVRKRLKNAKAKGVAYEHRAAKILGTERFKANTGGPIDLIPLNGMYVQVKGGKAVVTEVMRKALVSARLEANKHHGLPAVFLCDARGGPITDWICFPAKDWADWHGFGESEDAA